MVLLFYFLFQFIYTDFSLLQFLTDCHRMMTQPVLRPVSPTMQQWTHLSEIFKDECYKKVNLNLKAHLTMEITSCIKRFQEASALGMDAPTQDMLPHNLHMIGKLQQGTVNQATIGAAIGQQTQQPVEFPSAEQVAFPSASHYQPLPASPALSVGNSTLSDISRLLNTVLAEGRSTPSVNSDALNLSGSSIVSQQCLPDMNPKGAPLKRQSSGSSASGHTTSLHQM